jgi:hypothetical protein
MGFPILDAVLEIGKKVLGSVLPGEKIGEKDRLEIEKELELKMRAYDWAKVEKEYEDLVSARLLAEKELEKGNATTNALAALHRPIWSLACLGLFLFTALTTTFNLPKIELDETHKAIMMAVITFYFGGRTIEKLMEMWTTTKHKK